MSSVVGIDLSSHAIDLVKLAEDTNQAEWVRCELAGKDAWERTLSIGEAFKREVRYANGAYGEWWDDVYLVAIEAPYGRGQAGTTAILNRVVGTVAASLPGKLRSPERCWIVRPDEWKAGLGLKGKPTVEDLHALGFISFDVTQPGIPEGDWQNARDAYCLALWARDTNAKAIEQSLARVAAGTQDGQT